MKNLLNILACCVFVLLLTSVSFAKSENKTSSVTAKTYINCIVEGGACDNARQAAAGVAQDALVICNIYVAGSPECTAANNDARAARENAAFICDVYPRSPNEASYTPKEDKITRKFKTLGLNLLPQNAS